jgi:iron-sulfur cluster repair protein YtfE (RIC family)
MAETLAEALEREHREIDAGLARFAANPQEQASEYTRAAEGLRRHIYLEEELLFPALSGLGLVAPIFVMLREHGQMWGTLDALGLEVRADPTAPAVKELMRDLEVQLQHHNMKEERILYPQSEDALGEAQAEQLRAFIVAGTMPPDWVCEKAR